MKLNIHSLVSMPFQENTYVVWHDGSSEALVIDPGLEPDLIFEFLEEKGLRPIAILNTHGHADHIAGNAPLKDAFPEAPLVIGAGDEPLLTDPLANLSAPFGFSIVSPPADRLLREGDIVDYAGIRLEVLDVPGHSPGHIVFVHRANPVRVFGGDVLFQGSIGRTDFPGGDADLLITGIRTKLFRLPDDAIVYPGHGDVTTIGEEKRSNPFVRVTSDK
jgi:glyoxylase-like metal-dependent hydrolase (beta-lactamase superfamily II)